jgi:7-cyano-7-deazaguanine synthase
MSNTRNKVVLLCSGGLDSCASFALLSEKYKVFPIFIDYGQVSVELELNACKKISSHFKTTLNIVKLPWYKDLSSSNPLITPSNNLPSNINLNNSKETSESAKKVWLPNRNGLFLNIAACFAEKNNFSFISAGFNIEEAETFPDNSIDFIDAINNSLEYSTLTKVKFISPTAKLNKTEIAKIICDYNIENLFYSCYKSGDKMCGICESCKRSIRAFNTIGKLAKIKERFNEIPNT